MSSSTIRALFGLALALAPLALAGCGDTAAPSNPTATTETSGAAPNHPTDAKPKGAGPGAATK